MGRLPPFQQLPIQIFHVPDHLVEAEALAPLYRLSGHAGAFLSVVHKVGDGAQKIVAAVS